MTKDVPPAEYLNAQKSNLVYKRTIFTKNPTFTAVHLIPTIEFVNEFCKVSSILSSDNRLNILQFTFSMLFIL